MTRKQKEIRSWLILLAMQVMWIVPCVIASQNEKPVEEVEIIEEEEDIIRWKEEPEVTIEIVEKEQTTEPALVSLGEFVLTAYCPCSECSGKWGYQTSTGAIATEGRTVAVDPNVIPYGTVLIINGEEYVAEDCGSMVVGKHIDIFMESHSEAENFKETTEVFMKRGN